MPDDLDSLGHTNISAATMTVTSKRRASDTHTEPTLHDNHKASNKRRFILDQDAPSTDDTKQLPSQQTVASPLHVLAHAASTAPRLPISRRKRVVLNPPSPPPHVKKFNLLTGLVSHVDILLQITGYLPPQTLLDLYTISAPFHYVMDSHFTAFIKAATLTWAPSADRFFPWWCFVSKTLPCVVPGRIAEA
jgi:hypothetical protein